jgi:hypothetical protein
MKENVVGLNEQVINYFIEKFGKSYINCGDFLYILMIIQANDFVCETCFYN